MATKGTFVKGVAHWEDGIVVLNSRDVTLYDTLMDKYREGKVSKEKTETCLELIKEL